MENQERKFQFTKENVEATLGSFVVVGGAGVVDTPITVGNVTFEDKEGNPFTFNESGDRYAIVNLRAKTEEQMNHASELFEEGSYEQAMNDTGNLSISLPVDQAQKFAKGMLVTGTFDFRWSNKQEDDVLVCVGIAPAYAKAVKNVFARRNKKSAASEEGSTSTESIPNATKATNPTA